MEPRLALGSRSFHVSVHCLLCELPETTATTTVTELVLCGGGIPTGLGVDASGCADRRQRMGRMDVSEMSIMHTINWMHTYTYIYIYIYIYLYIYISLCAI